MDIQQPLSRFASKPLPGSGPTQHGYRRDHTRYETENGRLILQADPIKNRGISVEAAIEHSLLNAGKKGIVLTQTGADLLVDIDGDLLIEAVDNLVSNAVKYSNYASEVTC